MKIAKARASESQPIECWLQEAVAPAYDAVKAGQSRTNPAHAVFDEIRARHTAKTGYDAARRRIVGA